jgi:hypothetical protein
MKTYKVKLEDKAALLNRLEKAQVDVSSVDIKDNKPEGYFEITFLNDEDINKMKTIVHQSPKIDVLKEFLRKIIRKELSL